MLMRRCNVIMDNLMLKRSANLAGVIALDLTFRCLLALRAIIVFATKNIGTVVATYPLALYSIFGSDLLSCLCAFVPVHFSICGCASIFLNRRTTGR